MNSSEWRRTADWQEMLYYLETIPSDPAREYRLLGCAFARRLTRLLEPR